MVNAEPPNAGLLSSAASQLVKVSDRSGIASVLSEACRGIFQPAAVVVYLRVHETAPFSVAGGFIGETDLHEDSVAPFSPDLPDTLKSGTALMLEAGDDKFLERMSGLTLPASPTVIYAPMCVGNDVLGILSISAQSHGPFAPEQVSTAGVLSALATVTLHRIIVEGRLLGNEDRYRRIIAQANSVPYERDFESGALRPLGDGLDAMTGYPIETAGAPATWKRMVKKIVMRGDAASLTPQDAVGKIKEGTLNSWRADYLLERMNGTQLWVSDSSLTLFDQDGHPYASFGILEDITERKRAELFHLALSKLGERISAAVSPHEVALVAMEVADELFGWDSCFVGSYDRDTDMVSAVVNRDIEDGVRVDVVCSYDTPREPSPLFRNVLDTGRRLIERETDESPNPDEPEAYRTASSARLARSLMFAPMRDRGTESIGMMTIQSYKAGAYGTKDLERFQVLADYCSSALQRTRTEALLRESESRNELLATLAYRLNAASTTEEAGRVIAEAADALLGWDAFAVFVYDSSEDLSHPVLMFDLIDGTRCQVPNNPIASTPSPTIRRSIEEGGFLILRDSSSQVWPETVPFATETRRSQSLLFAPARTREGVVGVITVQSYRERAYTNDSLSTLQTLADSCAGALDRIWNETALWEERRMLRTMIDSIPDNICVKDSGFRFLLTNAAQRRAFGAESARELATTTITDWYPPELAAVVHDGDKHVLETGEPIFNREEKALANGLRDEIIVDTTKVPLRDRDGGVTGILAISRDITETRRAQTRLAVFAKLGQNLSATTTPGEAGRVIVSAAKELLGWDSCYLLLYDDETGSITPVFSVDVVGDRIIESSLDDWAGEPEGYGLIAIREGRVLVLRSNETSPPKDLYAFGDSSRSSESLMFVAVRAAGHVIGVLSIQSYAHDAYDDDDLELLHSLADQCAEALVRIRAQDATRISEERFALATKGANDGVWDWDIANNQAYFSERWKAILGHADAEIGTTIEEWFGRIHPQDREKVLNDLQAHLQGRTEGFAAEFRMRHRDGACRWVLCRGQAVYAPDGKALRVAGSLTDFTERHEFQEQLARAAFYDTLTGLANRSLFTDRLKHCLARAKRNPDFAFAVLFLDLDRFKMVNDSLGHMVGDRLLKEIGVRLAKHVRGEDTVARLGGDEFTVLLEDVRKPRDATIVARRILHDIAKPFLIDGNEIFTGTSIGIAFCSGQSLTVEQVLRDADTALYRAKETGRGRYVVFDSRMHEAVLEQMDIENGLRTADKNGELVLHYQPILSLSTNTIIGVEALVRWNHPCRGLLQPDAFIHVAEETGLIIQMGDWVLREACRQLADWQKRVPAAKGMFMSINLSPRQLASPSLRKAVDDALHANGLNPSCLHIEITENTILREPEAVKPTLEYWRSTGICVLLDDFGTGYSPLTNLTTYPVDYLKIDRSFVNSMSTSEGSTHIVRAVVSLARILDIGVIAEGAETTDQIEILRSIGCDLVQGFIISKPLPPGRVEEMLLALPDPPAGHARLP